MGRGRKPKPTHLRLVTGNAGRRPLNGAEPKPAGNLVDAPDHLSPDQVEAWRYAIECAPRGLLKRLDRDMLAIWVVASDLHRQAVKKVNALGILVKVGKDEDQLLPRRNPYLEVVNVQAGIMMKVAAELGFTPSSRSRIIAPPEDPEVPADAFSEFG